MYRDSAQSLDEHDRAVGAILIGEALVDNCDRAASRVGEPEAGTHDRWRAVEEVHDTYPEIWRHLDRARGVLAERGANTIAYDELRPHVKRAATDSEANHVDIDALQEVKRAIAELKLAVPGADWRAIAARTAGLVHLPLGNKRSNQRMVVGTMLAAFVLAMLAWFIAIIPEHKPTRQQAMRRELAGIQTERKARIDFLRAELGDRCLPNAARDLVRLMVLDGRGGDARELGNAYLERCGDDEVVSDWANAPRPGH
ncbi:MAG: hypothetical protein ABI678_09990 [Kofleriaceae bacterium]